MSHISASSNSTRQTVAVIGCGDIGQRLASLLSTENHHVIGIRRSAHTHPTIEYRQADCTSRTELRQVLPEQSDVIVVTMTPPERSDLGYQQAYVQVVDNLLHILESRSEKPRLILFVSSTSVYAQSQGEWIDEDSQAQPTSFSGKRLLEAEQRLRDSDFNTTIVRFSGIYGPGRYRLIQQVERGEDSPNDPPLFSNRIHVQDCARVLKHLMAKAAPQALYLASDCSPTALHDVKSWIAEALELANDRQSSLTPSALRASKRIGNQRLLDSGFEFQYPTFQSGYEEVIKRYLAENSSR
ncbi:MAG: NAD(P)-dependent oxidoreductase [Cellvibrionaceae bacterium]|nr:NAD(P)-dependent oxidoreductase [Cellvibrionaceae bacterium]|tara:strand:+ start:1820 stop:2713 length:894 start_codon:yes stop_codon:yes gene_type:complete